jgi:signal peptidase I
VKSKTIGSRLATAVLLLLAIASWLVLAPTSLGGSASYVTTHGISMQPRLHGGDLAVLRAAGEYRVGDIVAYRSRTLRTVVMHRIIARDGARYVFKGDNNDFVDPDRPTRAQLLGRLWVRVPRAGRALGWLQQPVVAAAITGTLTALLLFAGPGTRRRRRDRRGGRADRPTPGASPMPTSHPHVIAARKILAVSAAAAAVFLLLAVGAMRRPDTATTHTKVPYTETVRFAYHGVASSGAGPVYPHRHVWTGDPIFVRLVHRLRVSVAYRLATDAPARMRGTLAVDARLTSPSGWTRTVALAPAARFEGKRASARVMLDLDALRAITQRVETLTGAPGGDYTIDVIPRVRVDGTLAEQPLRGVYAPSLSFRLGALQLGVGDGSTPPPAGDETFAPSRAASVTTPTSVPATLDVRGYDLPVTTARWIALGGLVLAAAAALLAYLVGRRRDAQPRAAIQDCYGHLLVPISNVAHDPSRPPIDVTSIAALVALAERSERLVLHHHRADVDTYLVDDEGTIYRFQARHPAAAADVEPRAEASAPAG